MAGHDTAQELQGAGDPVDRERPAEGARHTGAAAEDTSKGWSEASGPRPGEWSAAFKQELKAAYSR